jgi:outer membrane protein TolC
MRRSIALFLILWAGLASLLFAGDPLQEKAATLDGLIDEAFKSNPQILAAYSSWIAEELKIKQVTSLPDPVARFSYFGENIETRVGPQRAKYGLSQKIPFPGKLRLKGKTAQKQAQMMKAKYEAVEREIIKKVKFAYYDLWWVDKAIQITEAEKDILANLESVAKERFETNLSPQQDVLKAQVMISKLIDKLFLLKRQRRSLEAKINSLLNRPQATPLGEVEEINPAEFDYALEQLRSIASENRQELIAANLDVERKEYEQSLARLDYLPDFTLGFNYIDIDDGHTSQPDDGQDAWMGTVSLNLPIWLERLDAQVKEKKRKLQASKNNFKNVENTVAFEVEDLYFKINTYKEIISLYDTALIPQTEQSFQAAKTAYETGKVDFLNWLDSERVLLQTRLAYYKAVSDYQKSIAFLERVVGRDL